MNTSTKTQLLAPTDSPITLPPDLYYTHAAHQTSTPTLWLHHRSLLIITSKPKSPLGPRDPLQGSSAGIWTPAAPSPTPSPSRRSGPILQTNLGSGAYPMPAAQTAQLQHQGRTSLLPSLAGQCRHALTVSVGTKSSAPQGLPPTFGVGRKGTKVREQHKPRRERKPVRSRRFSVWVLSCSKSLLRVPNSACLTATRVCHACHRGTRWLARSRDRT